MFALTSSDFKDGHALPNKAKANAFGGQCSGANTSPALEWTGAPAGTAAYAITLRDPDAHGFVHAMVADVPGDVTTAATGGFDKMGGVLGANDAGGKGYFGPCPPSGTHDYVFTLYALDAPLGLKAGFDHNALKKAMDGHVLASVTLTGTASR